MKLCEDAVKILCFNGKSRNLVFIYKKPAQCNNNNDTSHKPQTTIEWCLFTIMLQIHPKLFQGQTIGTTEQITNHT